MNRNQSDGVEYPYDIPEGVTLMKEFSNLGEEIKNTVQDAVDTMNFDHLNKNITDSVNSALNEVRSRLNIDSFHSGGPNNQSIRDWKVTYGSSQENGTKSSQYTESGQTNAQYSGGSNAQYNNQANTQYSSGSNTQYKGQSNAQSQSDMWEKRKQAAIERANQMRRNQAYQQKSVNIYNQQKYSYQKNAQLVPYAKNVPGRIAGPVLKGIGYTFGTMTGIGTAALCIIAGATSEPGVFLATQIVGSIFLGNLILAISGKRISSRVKRFRQYVSYIGDRKFCQIESLAAHTGFTKKFLVKDIRKMMRLGMFTQAHLDEKGTCLILDNETYQQYLQTTSEYQRRKQLEETSSKQEKKEHSSKVKDDSPEAVELRKTINEGKAYIRQITEANEAIPAIDISEKLSRLEQITSKIFNFVEQHPEQISELRKFMEYYLPITLKLVNAYKELDAQPVQGDNITSSKNEIVKTLDTINYAFENLLDSLYQSTAMEVSSDISVLEALFAQDGLTKKDFDLKKGGSSK